MRAPGRIFESRVAIIAEGGRHCHNVRGSGHYGHSLAVHKGYALRMFAITGWYHRYFSHRTFKTGRAMQFLFAMIGNSAAQRGALHWAAHHRHHHRFSDQPEDAHSPRQHGFWVSHMFWFSKRENSVSQSRLLKDFAGFPELMFMERFDFVVPTLLAFSTYALGSLLHRYFPGSHTSGWQMLIWGGHFHRDGHTRAHYHGGGMA